MAADGDRRLEFVVVGVWEAALRLTGQEKG